MLDLEKINSGSISEVQFLTDESVYKNITKSNTIYTYLFAKDGLYLVQNSELMITHKRIDAIKYKNLFLKEFPEPNVEGVKNKVSRAPKKYLEQIIEAFKYVQKKTKEEFFILLYWNKEERDFEMVVPKDQIISSSKAGYDYPEEEFDDNYVRYLEIHSHHSMAPKFSGAGGDDRDESNKLSSFYGVIGNLDANTTINNVSASFRIWNGYTFTYLSKEDVFNIPRPKQKELPDWMVEGIDEIIEKSKQNKSKNYHSYYGVNNQQRQGRSFIDKGRNQQETPTTYNDVPPSLLFEPDDLRFGLEEFDFHDEEDIIDVDDDGELLDNDSYKKQENLKTNSNNVFPGGETD